MSRFWGIGPCHGIPPPREAFGNQVEHTGKRGEMVTTEKNGQMDSIPFITHDHFQMESIEYISHDQVKRDLHELLEVSRKRCRQQNCPDSAQGKHYKRNKQ